ncbi:hypothetical protein, partial [Chlorobaculum sp. 24CR]|uniref:hypothetical protein n=1 Tax=Chlorobaculum sp. 24CR TaxID=2508878 RepID=UPI00352ABDF6
MVNAETTEAIKSARRSKLETANSVKNLINDLNADRFMSTEMSLFFEKNCSLFVRVQNHLPVHFPC